LYTLQFVVRGLLESFITSSTTESVCVGIQYKTEREWILSLIADGLREQLDYKICEKRFAVKILLTFYDSALADNQTQVTVLLSPCV